MNYSADAYLPDHLNMADYVDVRTTTQAIEDFRANSLRDKVSALISLQRRRHRFLSFLMEIYVIPIYKWNQ